MEQLKKNLQITRDSLAKNVHVVWGQTHDKLRVAAIESVRNRKNDPAFAERRALQADDCDSVLKWLDQLKTLSEAMPAIRDDNDPMPVIVNNEHHESETPLVQIEKDVSVNE